MKFRTKLTLIMLALIGVSVLGSGLIAADKMQKAHLESLEELLLREIHIILHTVPWRGEGTREERIRHFSEIAGTLKSKAEARVTFIDGDGTVLGDSDHAAQDMDNHFDRPEIREARETGSFGTARRYSSTEQADMFYVAVPVVRDGNIAGYLRLSQSLAQIQAHIRRLWSYLVTGLVLLYAAAGLIGYRVAQGVTKPLDHVTQAAKRIARLDYSARVAVKRRDEFGELALSINRMAASLEDQLARIRENEARMKNVLDHMITGVILIAPDGRISMMNPSASAMLGMAGRQWSGQLYREALQHVELAHLIREGLDKHEHVRGETAVYFPDERVLEVQIVPLDADGENRAGAIVVLHDITDLRRLERMRSEFVANVSHELKTPIAAVKGFAETLIAGAMDDRETARSFLQIIHDESSRLDRLIADLLELSKVESRRVPLRFSPVHLHPFMEQVVHMMKPEADKKRISLTMRVPPELYLEADEDRLRQVLINLVSNAVAYTPEGGRVTITAEHVESGDADKVRISVADTGIGIPKKDLPRIFERFYRVDKARSRSSGGTGLGLSIVKHLVELHRGSIRVDSELGLGSTFTIELPLIQ